MEVQHNNQIVVHFEVQVNPQMQGQNGQNEEGHEVQPVVPIIGQAVIVVEVPLHEDAVPLEGSPDMESTDTEEKDEDYPQILPLNDDAWCTRLLRRKGYHFITKVDKRFLVSRENQVGLYRVVDNRDNFQIAISIIYSDFNEFADEDAEYHWQSHAETIYAYIHKRFIRHSEAGMAAMKKKYENKEFGVCPRTLCNGHPVLPVGLSDSWFDYIPVKSFCANCREIYHPKDKHINRVNGAFIGRGFPEAFLMEFPHMHPQHPMETFTPTIGGFKISDMAYIYQYAARSKYLAGDRLSDTEFPPCKDPSVETDCGEFYTVVDKTVYRNSLDAMEHPTPSEAYDSIDMDKVSGGSDFEDVNHEKERKDRREYVQKHGRKKKRTKTKSTLKLPRRN